MNLLDVAIRDRPNPSPSSFSALIEWEKTLRLSTPVFFDQVLAVLGDRVIRLTRASVISCVYVEPKVDKGSAQPGPGGSRPGPDLTRVVQSWAIASRQKPRPAPPRPDQLVGAERSEKKARWPPGSSKSPNVSSESVPKEARRLRDDNCTPFNQWNMIDHGLSRFVRDLGACVLRARRPDLAQEEHMGLFSNLTLNTLDDLFLVQLQELYDAEQRLANALPKMAEASSSNPLRSAFKQHLGETKRHVARLERIFDLLGLSHQGQTCEAMKGLIAEGDEAINADGESDVKDAALIAAAQRVEHYEIAGYASARTFAQQLGHEEIAHFLNQTLDEEYGADETLTKIAESFANASAAGS